MKTARVRISTELDFNSGQGLGRVVDGSKYLSDILPRLRPSVKKRDAE